MFTAAPDGRPPVGGRELMRGDLEFFDPFHGVDEQRPAENVVPVVAAVDDRTTLRLVIPQTLRCPIAV
jgi:hypothetical protein